MDKKKILILGCGWAGNIIADNFIQQGDAVWASTTQESKLPLLETKGIQPFLLDFSKATTTNESIKGLQSQPFDMVVISVPVRRNEDPTTCLTKFKALTTFLTPLHVKQIIYLSSIGVYEPKDGTLNESSAVKEQGNIFQIETYLADQFRNLITLRLGGLFGFGRIPGRYFSQKICTVGAEKANYVHGTDLARAILELSNQDVPAGRYNLVAPIHPLKKDIYEKMAEKYNFLPVLYAEESCIQKEVSSQKLMNILSFTFSIPSPLDF